MKNKGKNQLEFGDYLNDYSKKVKDVEEILEKDKHRSMSDLEDKLRLRKEGRLRQIEAKKKQREGQFN
jgi:hypothetical protein